jgi:ATP-binding cassette subfamily B protein RaxB
MAECGLACVAMIAAYFGGGADLASLRRKHGGSSRGVTLQSVIGLCEGVSLAARPVRCNLADLRRLRLPCVLHWKFNHFVVLKRVSARRLLIHDPARGRVHATLEEADRHFTGVALELEPTTSFRKDKRVRSLRLRDILVIEQGFLSSASVALLLALLAELLLLVMPIYLQTVIDQVLMRGDHQMLSTLVLGFGILVVFQLLTGAMRQLTFQFLSQTTVFNLSSRVLRHLIHLPVAYFRSRRLGDIQQRMQSLTQIQTFVTRSAPALVLDALFLILVTVLMFAYAPRLTLLVAAVAGIYAGWRILIFAASLEQSNKAVQAEAAAQTHLLESLRSAQTIKMLRGERQRLVDWQNLIVQRINSQIRLGNLQAADGVVHQGLFQGLHLAMVYLLAKMTIEGQMSIGTVSAFVTYSGMFAARAVGIVNRVFEFFLLRVPLDRLADIVFNERESCTIVENGMHAFSGALRARKLTLSYPGNEPAVLEDCSFAVGQGDFVAIRGQSGSGKSTLLRILAGIEQPTSGRLYYDCLPASNWPTDIVRKQIATVFQDDTLLAGSIGENIALFQHTIDRDRMLRSAEMAAIDADIEALPMGYETLIGDLGAALSTGQVQRVLVARALYRQPRLLLLDEFTSGLDETTEKMVLASLVRLPVTRIVVTHSAAVMRAADRVYELSEKRLTLL